MVDTPERTTIESWNVDYWSKLDEVTGKIKSITDSLTNETTTDDDEAKAKWKDLINSFNDTFNDSFRGAVINELKDKPEKISLLKTTIIDSISRLKNKNEGKLPEDYKPLLDFLDKINKYFGTITTVDANHNVVDLSLKSIQLNWIQDSGTSQFFKWIDKKTNWNSILDEAVGRIENQIIKIGEIDSKKFLVGGEKIGELKILLENIWKVIKHNSVENVQKLQDYIYNNLEEADRDQFKKDNNFDEPTSKFDWKFWVSTLNWLNKVLEKTGKYLDAVTINLNNIEDPNKVDKVEPKWDPVEVEKWEKIVVDNLVKIPAWYKVEIDWSQEIKTDNPGDITVKINVKKLDGTEEQISVNVKVVDNTEVSTVQPTLDTTPLTLDNKEHWVMKNSLDIAQKAGLNWAIFYYLENPVDNNEGWETPSNKEYECFMKMKNAPEVYKVKIDSNWNLCPVAEIYNVNDTSSNKRILLENNPSCINYLQAKLQAKIPQDLLWSIKIDWSENKHDYRIVSYGEWKTIEPMTIDWLWVAKKTDPDYLSDCLVLLNFTNYLTRMDGEIDTRKFKNDNPDLKLDDDGKLWVRVKSEKTTDGNGNVLKLWKRYVVPKERFWLDWISQDVLKRFIKYNNGEHWEDNWDKKKENKYYDKIALEGEAQVLGDVTPHWNDGIISERTVATDVYGADIEWVGMIRFDETFVTKLWVFEDGEFKFNEGVEETETDGSKYIEDSEWNKFKKDVENGLWYRKINGYLLMWNFKSGKLDWNWLVIAANWDTFIWEFKDGKIDWKWKRIHQIFWGPCVTLDGTFNDVWLISWKCILWTESYNVRWDENEGKLLIVDGAEESTRYIDLTNWVVYNLWQERDFRLDEVVVARNYLRPKNPINFGSESEELLDGKTGKLDWVWAFDGNGNFNFIEEIKENDVDGKKTITINNETYTWVEYTKWKGLSIQPFTWNWYQRWDSWAAKWFFIWEYDAEEKKWTWKRIFENWAVYDWERKDTLENWWWTYTYPNWDKYEWNFVDGQFNGEWTYKWKNWCRFEWKFENDVMTTWVFVLKSQWWEYRFNVEKDGKWLKIVSAVDNNLNSEVVGKYIDVKNSNILNFDGDLGTSQDTRIFAVGKFGNWIPEDPMIN